MAIAFLPVRLFFYIYVTPNWIGNLGMMSLIAILMFYLTKNNKLGKFGIYFTNRIRRFTQNKIFWFAFISPLVTIGFYVWALYEIDFVADEYKDERDNFMASLIYGLSASNHTDLFYKDNIFSNVNTSFVPEKYKALVPMFAGNNLVRNFQEYGLYPPPELMIKFGRMNATERLESFENVIPKSPNIIEQFYVLKFLIGNGMYYLNEITGKWASHIISVWIMAEGEVILLLFFYRKFYKEVKGITWNSLGFSKNVRRYSISQHFKRQFDVAKCPCCRKSRLRFHQKLKIIFNWFFDIK